MKKLLYIGNNLSSSSVTVTSIGTLGSFLEQEGYEVFYASSKKNKLLRLLDMMYTTIKYYKRVDFVLIDVYSTLNFWYAVIISQMCRVLNVKYIAKLHGGDLPKRLKFNPILSNLIFKNAYKTTAPSAYLLSAFEKNYNSNLVYVPNAIDITRYDFRSREILHPKLLWVRSLAPIYNPKMAIEVLSILKKSHPHAELCMVGPDKGDLFFDLQKQADKLKVSVFFTGKLSKKKWISLSDEYSIFINTTHFDNTPISVIEAMALGLPIVSTNVGGMPFLIEDKVDGLLVDDNDAQAMADAISKLLSSPNFIQSSTVLARKKVEDYDWEKVKNLWFELLN